MKKVSLENAIPLPIKFFAGFIGLFGLFFAFSSYFDPTRIAPDALMSNDATRLAFYTVGATVIGLSVGLFLAILSNRPKSMALMLIVRTVVAIQDFFIAIKLDLGLGLVLFQLVVVTFGVASIVKLFKVIHVEEKK